MTDRAWFNPTTIDVAHPDFRDDHGFFDGVLNPDKGKTVAGGWDAPKHWGSSLSLAAGGVQMYGQTQASLAGIDNIFRNVHRTERNIEQIESEMMDSLDIQVRKVSRRHGKQMARIGASGVGFAGSPLMVMAESYARGMEDYDAIEERGRYAIDSAYQSIYDSLDQAKDIATSIMINSATTLASSVYGFNVAKKR